MLPVYFQVYFHNAHSLLTDRNHTSHCWRAFVTSTQTRYFRVFTERTDAAGLLVKTASEKAGTGRNRGLIGARQLIFGPCAPWRINPAPPICPKKAHCAKLWQKKIYFFWCKTKRLWGDETSRCDFTPLWILFFFYIKEITIFFFISQCSNIFRLGFLLFSVK